MNDYEQMVNAYKKAGGEDVFSDSKIAHIVLERDRVLGTNTVEGLSVNTKSKDKGTISVDITVEKNHKIDYPVHMCFGVLPEEGLQKIDMKIKVEKNAEIEIKADCIFPEAKNVRHEMIADIDIEEGGKYIYKENHFHGEEGGVDLLGKANINLAKNSTLKTLFTLLKGSVGKMEFDYVGNLDDYARMEMTAKIRGQGKDKIKISEKGYLNGEHSRGTLDSKIAIKDQAEAEVLNEMIATGPYSKGHVDCTEIIKDDAIARAVPIVEVKHPEANVTHEAAIGSVEDVKLQNLMARGLNEEEATEIIIQGMLNS